MSTTLSELVRDQILAEGPDITSTRDRWTHQAQYEQACTDYVDAVLNAMPNAELLERISNALAHGVRTSWLYGIGGKIT